MNSPSRLLALMVLLVGVLVEFSANAQIVNTLSSGNFNSPSGVAVDINGNVFVADTDNHAVKEILADGGYVTVKTLAVGSDLVPSAIALDASANIFIADLSNSTVKEILANGGYTIVKTIASANGNFFFPQGIAVDSSGNVFVADTGNNTVKEILVEGGYVTVNTLAGPIGNQSQFDSPLGIAVDLGGNVFVVDSTSAVKKIPIADGYATATVIAQIAVGTTTGDIAVDSKDNVFTTLGFGFGGQGLVTEIFAEGGYAISRTWGRVDGHFLCPLGVALDGHGNVFIADSLNNAVKEILSMPSPVVESVLPGSRSVETDAPATVFATILNTTNSDLASCQVALPTFMVERQNNGLFMNFQTTDPATNALTGTVNETVKIPANSAQSFVLTFEASRPSIESSLAPEFFCQDLTPAPIVVGVNTLDLTVSTTPIADIIALAATQTPDLTLHISNGVGAFAVATIDAGAAGALRATLDTGSATLPVTLALCQTSPSAECLMPPTPSVPIRFAANSTPTFSIFANATGQIPFSPGNSRIFVRFTDSGGGLHGSTSVAVTTN
jgi:hypothetical protein